LETYIDLKILGNYEEDAFIISIDKEELARLVGFSAQLVIRHWDGEKPLVLETYGEDAVRTREDGSVANNLVNLPSIKSVVVSS